MNKPSSNVSGESLAARSIEYANDTIAQWIKEADDFGRIPEAQKLRACKRTILALAHRLVDGNAK